MRSVWFNGSRLRPSFASVQGGVAIDLAERLLGIEAIVTSIAKRCLSCTLAGAEKDLASLGRFPALRGKIGHFMRAIAKRLIG